MFVPLTPEDELRLKNDAVETMLNGFDIVDENGLFVYANPAYLAMWGYDSLDEIVGTSPANHCAEPDTPVHIMRTLQEHGQGGFEFLARRKDGSTFEVYMACRLFRDSKGRKFFTGISTDMTERNKLLSQYRQAQKMEAIGRLVGGVVHDFNNILQVIYSSAQLMEENSHNPSVTARETERVLSAVERATALTKQLLLTSRRQPLNDGPLDLPRAITDVAHMFERLLGDHIQVEWNAPSEFPPVCLDQALFEQIMVNLVVNARDAMALEGGTITVELTRQDEFARLLFRDQGCGIEAGHLEKIFEPFFTTKAEGKGSGLGLSTVYGIVNSHGGSIKVDSTPGVGTTFIILLPLGSGTPAPRYESEEPVELQGLAGKTILVAEDNEQVGQVLRQILERAKCHVLFSRSGREALKLFRQHGSKIDLAVLDILMPDLNGTDVLKEIRKQNSDLPAFFCSGYNDSRLEDQNDLIRRTPILQKPYSVKDLIAMMRKAISV